MPQHNIFTRARRIFQNAAQPAQSQNQHPNPTDSANHSQYETDGSSYEMLVVDTPTKSHRHPPRQQPPHPHQDNHPNVDDPPPTPRPRQSRRLKTEPQTPTSERPSRHRQSDSEKTQTEPRTPPPVPAEEPQTPSQKLPTALRRIDATPVNVGKSSGYNLRSRTRSHAPPTPQRTPARSQRQKTPARSRDLGHAPSARTTSGVAARPSIISRHQIDESSVITLRTMCRRFGLPTNGNKADLRARALKEFESHHVLEEQNQPLEDEVKQPNDSIVARASGDGRRGNRRVKADNEENSGQVPQVMGQEQEERRESEEEDTGKQLTTSTVKPAGGAKRLPVEARVAGKSDEPSVHAKSDAPEKDPVRQLHPAEWSIANSPVRPIARQAEKFSQPTVSSTGVEASSPKSPRPPTPHPTPPITNPSVPFSFQNRQQGPTESVDARGGGLDVGAIFQELAAGRRKLTQVEYETVLKSLKDKAPDRPPPLKVSINAPHVSLNTLPSTPLQMFKPPTAKALPEEKVTLLPQKTAVPPQDHVAGSSNKPHALVTPTSKSPVAEALEKSDNNKRSIQKDADAKPTSDAAQDVENAVPDSMEIDNPGARDTARGNGDEGLKVYSKHNRNERAGEIKQVSEEEDKLPQSSSKAEPIGNEDDGNLNSTITNPKPVPIAMNQISLPTVFAGAKGGPHEGNIVNTEDRQPAPFAEEAAHENGPRDEDLSRELEPPKDTPRLPEVKRSGFATPRELVRRFNRFGEGHSVLEDDLNKKPEDNYDPATSLLRRNARRSSSGVPLFYSTRGPSTSGRSILKARTASKARESHSRLRQIDRLQDLSGRPSFRIKRPLSASAGALLVDLRRISGSHRPSSERPEQRGSYQAEVARRPPPMAASALKILKELEQIQDSNRTQTSRKRNVSPPPLPPSVVKRARRSGQFSKAGSSSGHRLSIFEQEGTEEHNKFPGVSLSGSEPKELMSSARRLTPKIPIAAYGAGKKRSKRSRNGADTDVIRSLDTREKKDIIEQNLAGTIEGRDSGSSPPRTRKRLVQKENLTFGGSARGNAKHSVEASPQESTFLGSPTTNAERQVARSTEAEVEGHDSSFPAFGRRFASKRSLKFAQPLSSEDPTNRGSASVDDKTNAEGFNATRPTETAGNDQNENEDAAKAVQSVFGRSKFNQPFSKKPSFFPSLTSVEQQAEQQKGLLTSPGTGMPKETREETAHAAQDLGSNAISWAAMTGSESLTGPTKESVETPSTEMEKPNGASQEEAINITPSQAQTTHQFGKSGVQAAAFPTYTSSGDSPFAASAFAAPKSETPPGAEGKDQEKEGEKATRNEPSILHGTASPFGSFGGTKGATAIASAPSKPSDQGGSVMPSAFGVSPFAKPTQKQPPLFEKDDIGGSKASTLKSQPIPFATTASLSPGDFKAPTPVQVDLKTTTTDPGNLSKSTSDVVTALPVKPTFEMPQNEAAGLSSVGEAAPSNITDSLVASKHSHITPSAAGDMVTTPVSGASKTEKPDVSGQTKDDTTLAQSEKKPDLFGSGPFSVPTKETNLQPTFPFSSAGQVPDKAQSGPFTESKFNPASSSANSSTMFAFGSSVEKDSTVTPAPSFGGFSDSAALDKGKQNPFTQTTNPTPFTFGSQPSSGSGAVTKSSGPAFGLPSGSEAGTTFGQSNANTTTPFASNFGSAPPLFNGAGSNNFAAGSTAPAFGAPLFGNVEIPSTPFGASSGPGIAPALGATSTINAASSMFGSASAGTSEPAFGGASAGSFSFPNSNGSTFGATNTQQPNPFQSGNPAPTSSGGVFGAGGFNMGSAARGPPMPRRRLRGRRTLR